MWHLKLVISCEAILILSFFCTYLFILQVSCVKLIWLKSLNFEGTSILVPPKLVKFYLSFIFACLS